MYAMPLCCRSWTCDYCRPERRARVAYQASLGAPDTFITLTINPRRNHDTGTDARELVVAWRAFVKYAKKLYGYASIPFFAVFEATKLGQPHLHILCRVRWIDQRVLSKFMKNAIDAPIVDVRRCTSTRAAARYVAKYIGKEPGKFGTCKRYWQTRDYRKYRDDEPEGVAADGPRWQKVERSVVALLQDYEAFGHQVVKRGVMWVITTRAPPW